ncbi:MAG: UvrD-helicase domain-containing protein [Pseudomonadota bacterium]
MSIEVPDLTQRGLAVDPKNSCVVQAPAGSGKTTLLVERFLNLLNQVEQPEEILAITFTKKAAAEMRHRVFEELSVDSPLAEAVRQRSELKGWDIANNPGRLRVQTIDSFALSIVARAPNSPLDAQLSILEQPQDLYWLAATQLFQRLLDNKPEAATIADFLAHFDNDTDRTSRLLTGMLARRDQWIDIVVHLAVNQDQQSQIKLVNQLNQAIEELRRTHLDKLRGTLGSQDQQIIDRLADHWQTTNTIEAVLPRLLTGNGKLRRRLTAREGIEETELRRLATQWLSDQHANDVAHLFEIAGRLPTIIDTEQDLETLHLCCVGLSLAAIQLEEVFAQARSIDFTGLLIAAKSALADDLGATDLAQLIDYQINHILVDEFQDTSRSQAEFFNLLTSGWQADDERSFFAVGDPMQSIYRFRDADVGIFLETAADGLPSKPLQLYRLEANFRSDKHLVRWTNQLFAALFPGEANASLGQITFNAATPMREYPNHQITCVGFPDKEDEVIGVVEHIRKILREEPGASIALLCRARSHVHPILKLLDHQRVDYQATDIYPLANELIVRDLLSLYQAVVFQAESMGWMGLLRSPMLGFSLDDIYSLRQGPFPQTLEQLSGPRAERLRKAMAWTTSHLHERPLREVIEGAFTRLGGWDAYVDTEHTHALAFLNTLESLGERSLIPGQLEAALTNLYADATRPETLQIMTIHKSKGLEFDHVIVPNLEHSAPSDQAPLVSWRQSHAGVLLGLNGDSVHSWLKYEERQRSLNEDMRLMYVACTRAKQSLWLSCSYDPEKPEKLPGGLASLLTSHLERLPPGRKTQATQAEYPSHYSVNQQDLFSANGLYRLPLDYQWHPPANPLAAHLGGGTLEAGSQDLIGQRFEVALGNLVHRILAWITQAQIDGVGANQWHAHVARWGSEQVIDPDRHVELTELAKRQIELVLGDPTGQWIVAQHTQGVCEAAYSGLTNGSNPSQVVIDRMFVEDGIRWIIDYKSATPHNFEALQITDLETSKPDLGSFIEEQSNRYRGQLEHYRDIIAALHPGDEIRCALYFTGLPHFRTLNL